MEMATALTIGGRTVAELRERLLREKAARRRCLATAPIPEKLKVLEEMRDATRALKAVREKNKATIREAVAARSAKSA
jgi:hypothetical protein